MPDYFIADLAQIEDYFVVTCSKQSCWPFKTNTDLSSHFPSIFFFLISHPFLFILSFLHITHQISDFFFSFHIPNPSSLKIGIICSYKTEENRDSVSKVYSLSLSSTLILLIFSFYPKSIEKQVCWHKR